MVMREHNTHTHTHTHAHTRTHTHTHTHTHARTHARARAYTHTHSDVARLMLMKDRKLSSASIFYLKKYWGAKTIIDNKASRPFLSSTCTHAHVHTHSPALGFFFCRSPSPRPSNTKVLASCFLNLAGTQIEHY